MNHIRKDQVWQFTGPGMGIGQLHRVVLVSAEEVVTIGLPIGQGFSWIGTVADFVAQFRFSKEAV